MPHHQHSNRIASFPRQNEMVFTLTELLVVIAIIAILAGFLLPTLMGSMDEAKKTACISNLKQVITGMELYKNDYNNKWPLYLTQLYYSGQLADPAIYLCPKDPHSGKEGCRPNGWGVANNIQYPNTDRDGASYRAGTWVLGTPLSNSDSPDDLLSSYIFEFNCYDCEWQTGKTWLQAKQSQLMDGVKVHTGSCCSVAASTNNTPISWIPVVRCFWHLPNVTTQLPLLTDTPVLDITNFMNVRPNDFAYWEHHYAQ